MKDRPTHTHLFCFRNSSATSVLLALLLVILARMFQTKFKAHFPPRCVRPAAARLGLCVAAVSGREEPLDAGSTGES